MKTIQMEIDDVLLEEIERVTKATGTTPAKFISNALERALRHPDEVFVTAKDGNNQTMLRNDMPALRDPEGMWAKQGINITAEDIAEARREMWGKFDHKEKQ